MGKVGFWTSVHRCCSALRTTGHRISAVVVMESCSNDQIHEVLEMLRKVITPGRPVFGCQYARRASCLSRDCLRPKSGSRMLPRKAYQVSGERSNGELLVNAATDNQGSQMHAFYGALTLISVPVSSLGWIPYDGMCGLEADCLPPSATLPDYPKTF